MMIRADPTLSTDFLIAQSNNCSVIFDQIQNLLDPVKRSQTCTDEELEKVFSEHTIVQNSFKIIQEVLIKVSDAAYIKTKQNYIGDF